MKPLIANVSKLDDRGIDFGVIVEHYEDQSGIKPVRLLTMSWCRFIERFNYMTERVNLIIPPSHQKGLVFNITSGVGDKKHRDDLRATWVTVTRGSNDWFITDIAIDRPATISIHPVNLALVEDNHDTLWSIVEHVTKPNWFNK